MKTRRGVEKIRLWHPDSPGIMVWVKPCFLRRIGIIRSEFATLGETSRFYRELRRDRISPDAEA